MSDFSLRQYDFFSKLTKKCLITDFFCNFFVKFVFLAKKLINEDIFSKLFLIKLNFCENRSDFRYRGMILRNRRSRCLSRAGRETGLLIFRGASGECSRDGQKKRGPRRMRSPLWLSEALWLTFRCRS
jgi:hypothetical protein